MSTPASFHRLSARPVARLVRFTLVCVLLLTILGTTLPAPMHPGSVRSLFAAPAVQSGGRAEAVSAGWGHTCVLMTSGEVRCWGDNQHGQASVPADLDPASQISVGFNHTCAITRSGSLRCWGDNNFGQADVPDDLGSVSQVSAGTEVTCALTSAGNVRCWGIPITYQPDVPPDLGTVQQIGASVGVTGHGATCAVTDAGNVRCWGNIFNLEEMFLPADLGQVSQISVGDDHACTVDQAGNVRCWGSDGSGQTTVPSDLDPVSQISAGFDHTCAVTRSGALRCWGDNAYGQISVPSNLGSVSQVSAGVWYTCAVTANGTVSCWGNDADGQLGDATPPVDDLPDGLVYSAGGQQYQVDLNSNSSTAIGAAPPQGSIPGPGDTYLWVEEGASAGNLRLFQIIQASRDGRNRQVLLDSDTFFQQFSDYVSINHRLVLSADNEHLFFIGCQMGMGEAALCNFFQLELASRTVSLVETLSNETYPTWINPDGRRAIYAWDLACTGSLQARGTTQQLSGTPVSVAWLPDDRFIYSRYLCSGIWTPPHERVDPQYDIVLANANGDDDQVLVPGKVAGDMALAPEQQALAFITSDPGEMQSGEVALWVVNLDGSGLRKVLDLPDDATDLRWADVAMEDGATPLPTAEIVPPSDMQLDLGNGLILRSEYTEETSDSTNCTITINKPVLDGNPAWVAGFNQAVERVLTTGEIGSRLEQCRDSDLPEGLQNYANVDFEVVYADERFVSLRFTVGYTMGGGVRQSRISQGMSYDLVSDTEIDLASLFLSGLDYLTVLSAYAFYDLTQREVADLDTLLERTEPVAENYQSWNITPGGLLITFDRHFVTAVDGPQEVLVPVDELKAYANFDSPVAVLWGLVVATPTPDPNVVSYVLSGRVTDADGNPIEDILISGDTCGTTTTAADGTYILIWYAAAPEPCTVRPYQQNVSNDEWGAVFDPPIYTFETESAAEQDFVMHSERRPLVFVPGIMGSYLYEIETDIQKTIREGHPITHERWPGLGDYSRGFDGGRLRLDFEPLPPIFAGDAIRNYFGKDIYQTFINKLQAKGSYAESRSNKPIPLQRCNEAPDDTTLFVFAYDWRKSNDGNADLLRDYIECVREQTGSEYVDVVAHSMGGVLTRRYVLENQNNHYIDRFISVATPWLGAPRAIAVMETGQYPGISEIGIQPWQLKPVAASSPGAHELLPSSVYFTRSDELFGYAGSVFWERGWDYNQNGNAQETYTYEAFASAFDQRFDSNPATTNRTFHTAEQNDLSEWYGVDHYNFYGVIDTDMTPVRFRTLQTFMCELTSIGFNAVNSDEVVCANSVDHFRLTLSAGDGTVPVISAVPPPLEVPANCNAEDPHVACFYDDKDHAEHGALVNNNDVITALINVLTRRSPDSPVATGSSPDGNASLTYSTSFSALAQQPDAHAAQPAHYITILNTASATLADTLGNTTDAISGTLTAPVPNASYYILGERAHMFVMPASEPYTVTLPVGEAPMYLELRTGTGDTSTQTIRYSDQTFPLTTTAMLSISPQGVADLRYDSDGDGSFDTVVPPTVSVSGDAANDTESPAVSITVDKQGGRWLATITATDDRSGVKQVLYSTDDRQYALYEDPFEVNPDEVAMLYAFADDNVANRSGVVVYDLAQGRGWLVLLRYPGMLLAVLLLVGGGFVARRRMRPAPARNVRAAVGQTVRLRKSRMERRLRPWMLVAVIGGVVVVLLLLALVVFFPGVLGRQQGAVAPVPPAASHSAGAPVPVMASATATSQATATTAPPPTVTLAAPPTATTPPVAEPTPMSVVEPSLVSRSDWGADVPGSAFIPHTPARIILSHNANPCCSDGSAAARLRADQAVHMQDNGWSDIAYHYIVAPDGTMFAGRAADRQSDSSYAAVNPTYDLDGSLVIGVLGNYDTQEPTAAGIRSITWLMAWLCQEYAIAPDEIYHFNQVAPTDPWNGETTSPGRNMPKVAAFRANVTAILAGERQP
jgi:pimeloyl-ACP methyl ester carboxylesterase